jgi:hypothetical protein
MAETFCFEAIESQADDDRPYIVYYLGDFDRSGRDAAASLKEKLERFADERGVDVNFIDLAISEDHIGEYDANDGTVWVEIDIGEVNFGNWLPTREPKRKSRADQLWAHRFACELDAIEPDDLRALVRGAIEQHPPPDQLEILKVAEASEREQIKGLVKAKLTTPPPPPPLIVPVRPRFQRPTK